VPLNPSLPDDLLGLFGGNFAALGSSTRCPGSVVDLVVRFVERLDLLWRFKSNRMP